MLRRLLIALLITAPALALIVWLAVAQLPRWTAPQAGWFAANTPGVCAAVASLKLYQGVRADTGGISSDEALKDAVLVFIGHYDLGTSALTVRRSDPLEVQATLPGDERRAYYVITMALSGDPLPKATVIYLDAQTGDARALITALEVPPSRCNFDVRGALVAAAKSPPVPLLIAYGLLVIIAFVARLIWTKRGRHR